MCYSEGSSLAAFSISFLCFLYLVYDGTLRKNKRDVFAGIVVLLIGSMQMVEYNLWKDQACGRRNHFFSWMIVATLYLQCLIGVLSCAWLFRTKPPYLLLMAYTIFTLVQLAWLNQKHLCSTPGETSRRLVWAPYVTNTLYEKIIYSINMFFYFYFFIFIANTGVLQKTLYPVRNIFLPLTFIIAWIYALLANNTDLWGSIWCFMAVGLGPISILHI